MLKMGHVLVDRRILGEAPGQHELRIEHSPQFLDHAAEGGSHPVELWIALEALHATGTR
jgi:hypothetical protein